VGGRKEGELLLLLLLWWRLLDHVGMYLRRLLLVRGQVGIDRYNLLVEYCVVRRDLDQVGRQDAGVGLGVRQVVQLLAGWRRQQVAGGRVRHHAQLVRSRWQVAAVGVDRVDGRVDGQRQLLVGQRLRLVVDKGRLGMSRLLSWRRMER